MDWKIEKERDDSSMWEDNYLEEWNDYKVGEQIPYGYAAIHWSSDWGGDEVGYDDIPVVGLYSIPGEEIYMYINSEDGTILEMWEVGEDDE